MFETRTDRRSLLRSAAAMALPLGAAAPLRTITDAEGHEMPYAFAPAADPRNARTVVRLHGHGPHGDPSASAVAGWNVLVPLDRAGYEGEGSWWLGEGGDYFTADLLHACVKRVRRRIGGDQGLYVIGSSMGGYGALLHGMLLGADAVFANAFQSRLSGTAFTDALSYAIDPVGVPADSPLCKLTRYVRGKTDLPVFFLDFNRYDHAEMRYYEEHFVPFRNACRDVGVAYHTKVYPIAEHTSVRTFSGILGLFDRYRDEIEGR